MCRHRFEHRAASYPKWRIADRGSVAYVGVRPETLGIADDDVYRPRRIRFRPDHPRHGRKRGSTRCQMQKLATGKFHDEPPNSVLELTSHSGLMPASFTTLPHFAVSPAMCFPKSAGESASTVPPKSASRAFILGSARAALISLLSLSTIAMGVFLGAPKPPQKLAS